MSDLLLLDKTKDLSVRDKVNVMENMMFQMPQLDLPVKHHFSSQGVYARELFIPKGTLLTGKIHKYEQINIMASGDLSVLTEEGIKRVQAPFVLVAPAGTKRIAYAHEDTVWITVHATEETDVELLEKQLVAETDQEYLEFCEQGETKCLSSQQP
jgi:quercetin dioxygenase-like cupin family protein